MISIMLRNAGTPLFVVLLLVLTAACGSDPEEAPSPEPSPTGSVAPTDVPEPTVEPAPTATLRPTATSEPSVAEPPTPTAVPEPTATAPPQATVPPEPSPTATPASVPEHTTTPRPPATATPGPEIPTPSPNNGDAVLSLTIDADSTWQEVFDDSPASVQVCIRDVLEDDLEWALAKNISSEIVNYSPDWEESIFKCLNPEIAQFVFLYATKAYIEEFVELDKEEFSCVQEWISNVSVATLAAADNDWDERGEFWVSLHSCAFGMGTDLGGSKGRRSVLLAERGRGHRRNRSLYLR